VYRKMAANIYNIKEGEVTGAQRFIGKTTILGCGYGLGAVKFREMLKVQGVDITAEEAQRIISVYRSSSTYITTLWRQAQNALMGMYQGDKYAIGRTGVIRVVPEENGLLLPSGILMRYTDLKAVEEEKGLQFSYKTREGRVKIYGGKVIENVCQGIARCVMAEQMLRIAKRYKVLLTVHDSVVCSVPDAQVDEAAAFISSCMRWSPDWAVGLPVRGDVEVGKNYGECTAWIEPIENHLGRSVG
jgi:DNA polymerase